MIPLSDDQPVKLSAFRTCVFGHCILCKSPYHISMILTAESVLTPAMYVHVNGVVQNIIKSVGKMIVY